MLKHLTLTVPGATPGELRRGLEAAQRALDDWGVDAYSAANHHWLREMQMAFPLKAYHPTEHEACEAWLEACCASVEACCAGWNRERPFPLGSLNLSDDYRAEMRRVYPALAAAVVAVDREMLPDRAMSDPPGNS